MLRALILVVSFFGLCAAAAAQDVAQRAPRPLASALVAAGDGRWDRAATLAARDGPVAADIIEWLRLQGGGGQPAEILRFLGTHSDWPGLTDLRRRSEAAMAEAETAQVLAFYDGYRPQTGTGALSLARALAATGQEGEAKAGIVLAWRTLDLTRDEHDAFLAAYGKLLAPHHQARLRMALWRGLRDVEQMLPLVDEKTRALARIRQRVRDGKPLREKDMPEGAADDPAVAQALFERNIRNGRSDQAIDIILRKSNGEGGLGEAGRWAGWRRWLARAQMRAGEAETAYRLAANHRLVSGADYADLEWLSGYIALRYLDDPARALAHFQNFSAAVETPISLGRAGYWIGRSEEALGKAAAAQRAFADAARYQTSFYGLLAAGRAGLPFSLADDHRGGAGDWRDAAFSRSPLFKAGVLLRAAERSWLARAFLVRLSDSLDRDGLSHLGDALEEIGAPYLAVRVGKRAARRGIVVTNLYYPLHPLRSMELPVATELALSIARRESEFNPGARSAAGAAGLMQLMPATAADMAGALGLAQLPRGGLGDWRLNVRLGAAYLAELARRFDGNPVMVAAAYNAGPSRPPRWIAARGDPRGTSEEEIVDWIEHIPFRETRNYVMRVSESLPVYRARLGKPALPVPFWKELTGAGLLDRRE